MSRPDRSSPGAGRRRWPTVLAAVLLVALAVVLVWLLVTDALLGDDAGSSGAAAPARPDRAATQEAVPAGPTP